MKDPLQQTEENGFGAGIQVIEDYFQTTDLDECINQIRLAASVDSKFNWHLLEAIARLAMIGFEETND